MTRFEKYKKNCTFVMRFRTTLLVAKDDPELARMSKMVADSLDRCPNPILEHLFCAVSKLRIHRLEGAPESEVRDSLDGEIVLALAAVHQMYGPADSERN